MFEMEKNQKAEYERSLEAWRGKLRAAIESEKEDDGHAMQTYNAKHSYNNASSQQPLINRVTNSWRDDEKVPNFAGDTEVHEPGLCDLEDDASCPNISRRAIRSRRFRRMLAILALAGLLLCWMWSRYLRPRLQEEWDFAEGFLSAKVNGTYGFAKGGHFDGMWIKDLDQKLLPGGPADLDGKRRLVFVGDIHGCKKELSELLDNAGFNPKHDHLIATGDVLSKGPDSPGVLDKLMELHAESVRGNHEDRLLEAAKTLLASNLPPESPAATSQGYSKDHALLKQLKRKHIEYLYSMPLILRIPTLPLAKSKSKGSDHIAEEMLVVHAGLVPHVPLLKQDPYFVMNMRSIDHTTHVPSALRETKKGKSKPWFEIWNWYNERLARGRSLKGFHVYTYADYLAQKLPDDWLDRVSSLLDRKIRREKARPQVAIYGHDSKTGLQMHRWSKGLDSACVSGGHLSAMVLDAQGRTRVVQVRCKNYR